MPEGPINQLLPQITQAATADVEGAVIGHALPAITQAATATVTVQATVTQSLPAVSQYATAGSDVGTESDRLRIYSGSDEIEIFHLEATADGVVLLQVSGSNGTGTATLHVDADAGTLAWEAPGEATGAAVSIPIPGYYLLPGVDVQKWARVFADPAHMNHDHNVSIRLKDPFNNALASDDVSAAEATAGDVETHTLTVKNVSADTVNDVTAWLESGAEGTSYLELSNNGVAWSSPTTDPTGVSSGNLTQGGTATLHIRRTIGAGEAANESILSHVNLAYQKA